VDLSREVRRLTEIARDVAGGSEHEVRRILSQFASNNWAARLNEAGEVIYGVGVPLGRLNLSKSLLSILEQYYDCVEHVAQDGTRLMAQRVRHIGPAKAACVRDAVRALGYKME
jgi:hypothetical protein